MGISVVFMASIGLIRCPSTYKWSQTIQCPCQPTVKLLLLHGRLDTPNCWHNIPRCGHLVALSSPWLTHCCALYVRNLFFFLNPLHVTLTLFVFLYIFNLTLNQLITNCKRQPRLRRIVQNLQGVLSISNLYKREDYTNKNLMKKDAGSADSSTAPFKLGYVLKHLKKNLTCENYLLLSNVH